MRSVVLCAVLAIGCGKVPGGPDKAEPAKEDKREATYPKPTAALRVDSYDLYSHYSEQVTGESAPHKYAGKRVLLRMGGGLYGVKTADGKRLVLEGSDKAFKRPRVVVQMRNATGFMEGPFTDWSNVYFEVVIRGPVALESRPWSKEWLKLEPQSRLKEQFVFVDDAVRVADPG